MAACFLRTREFGECGEFRGITEFVSLNQCNNDLSHHLSRCHLNQERITEGGTFRVVLHDRSAKRRDVCLSEAPRLSWAVLGKPDKVKVLQVPWAQGRAQSSQDWSGIYFESIKGSDGNVWFSCSCWCTWVSTIKFFSNFFFWFERIETHEQLI